MIQFHIVYAKDGDTWLASEPVTGVATEGNSFEEAQAMIKEALELHFEEVPEVPVSAPLLTGSVMISVGV